MNIHQRMASNHGKRGHSYAKPVRRDMIFVFGSNKAGIHGGGAARAALLQHGAIMGQGFGHHGNSYAIPTKGEPGGVDRQRGIGSTLPLVEIQTYIEDFMRYARANPKLKFQVTQLGCGLAGLKPEWIAPMFLKSPENCYFDTQWQKHLPERVEPYRFWGSF